MPAVRVRVFSKYPKRTISIAKMAKCATCNKLVSKKNPGIQCGKCSKWFHSSCVQISKEQLSILCSTDAVDWKCKTCSSQYKSKRLSAILPEIDDDDNTDSEQVIIMKENFSDEFLRELRSDIRQAIKEEVQQTLNFYSEQYDNIQKSFTNHEDKIKRMENQHKDLHNKYSNLQLKYDALEQKLNFMEQSQMVDIVEICGINKEEQENVTEITQKVATKIQQNPDDILNAYRKERRAPAAQQRTSSSIVVTLKAGRRDSWLDAARSSTITPRDLGHHEGANGARIYIREALTPATAFLLWKAKSELRKDDLYKFVWCKRGAVLIRKDEKSKIQTVRSERDIEKWKQVNT